MADPVIPARLASQGDSLVVAGKVRLHNIIINTGVASGVIHVFATSASIAASKIAQIDATTAAGTTPRQANFGGALCENGLNVWMGGGSSDVTVLYSKFS